MRTPDVFTPTAASSGEVEAAPANAGAGASPSPPAALVRALRQVLRPLVRLMLARGITYPYLAELLKGLFVEVADKDFRLSDKPPTDSRVSLVSGVHRKDVSRLRAVLQTPDDIAPSVVSLGAQLVAHWLGSALYLDEAGQPKPLARFASEGGAMSFEALVASVNSDIRSRVVLDEWLRLGVVRLDDERRVCLNTEAFVPAKGFDEKAFYFGHNLHDHAAAAVHNLLGAPPTAGAGVAAGAAFAPFMERSVHYDELSPESIARLARQSEELGMQALLAVNKTAMEAEQHDSTQGEGPQPRQRMTFGIYFYSEPAAPGDAQGATGDKP
jgi:Family of unknown function (DUF6502)